MNKEMPHAQDQAQCQTYWQETREYFKEKTKAFEQVKKRRHIEIMKEELERELIKYNKNKK